MNLLIETINKYSKLSSEEQDLFKQVILSGYNQTIKEANKIDLKFLNNNLTNKSALYEHFRITN